MRVVVAEADEMQIESIVLPSVPSGRVVRVHDGFFLLTVDICPKQNRIAWGFFLYFYKIKLIWVCQIVLYMEFGRVFLYIVCVIVQHRHCFEEGVKNGFHEHRCFVSIVHRNNNYSKLLNFSSSTISIPFAHETLCAQHTKHKHKHYFRLSRKFILHNNRLFFSEVKFMLLLGLGRILFCTFAMNDHRIGSSLGRSFRCKQRETVLGKSWFLSMGSSLFNKNRGMKTKGSYLILVLTHGIVAQPVGGHFALCSAHPVWNGVCP